MLAAANHERDQVLGIARLSPSIVDLIVNVSRASHAEMSAKLDAAQEQAAASLKALSRLRSRASQGEARLQVAAVAKEVREISTRLAALAQHAPGLSRGVAGCLQIQDTPVLSRALEREVTHALVVHRAAFWSALYQFPIVQRSLVEDLQGVAEGTKRAEAAIFLHEVSSRDQAMLRERAATVLEVISGIAANTPLYALSAKRAGRVASVLLESPAQPETSLLLSAAVKSAAVRLELLEAKLLCSHSSIQSALASEEPMADEYRTLQRSLRGGALEVRGRVRQLAELESSYLALKQYLVASNQRLIIANVGTLAHAGSIFEDCFQDSAIGLMRAAEKFVPSSGFSFATYASFWIRQSSEKTRRTAKRIIPLPHNGMQGLARLQQSVSAPGAASDVGSLAKASHLSHKAVRMLLPHTQQPKSLSSPSRDGADKRSARIEDRSSAAPYAALVREEARTIIREAVTSLSAPQAQVISLRFGLGGDAPMSLAEAAAVMGCTKEWVRQLQKTAMRRLAKTSGMSDTRLGKLARALGLTGPA